MTTAERKHDFRAELAELHRNEFAAMTAGELLADVSDNDCFAELFRRYACDLQAYLVPRYGAAAGLRAFAAAWLRVSATNWFSDAPRKYHPGDFRPWLFLLARNLAIDPEYA